MQSNQEHNTMGFWEGYCAWLCIHKKRLWFAGALLLVIFIAVLVASQAPQDPFTYELY